MTELIGSWVRGLAGTAAICALALCACPEGRVKRVLRLVCGVVTAYALISPLLSPDMEAYSSAMARYRAEARAAAESGEELRDALSRNIIEDECAAYILDKAEALGMTGVSAGVSARWGDGCWFPWEAKVAAQGEPRQWQALAEALEAELGIPPERQTREGEENEADG